MTFIESIEGANARDQHYVLVWGVGFFNFSHNLSLLVLKQDTVKTHYILPHLYTYL
jgi:hypothetical protein